MIFQEKLKKLRKEKNISQYDLAEALNVSRSVVAKWEVGLALPNDENLARLGEYFGVSPKELTGDPEYEQAITVKNKKVSRLRKIICAISAVLALAVAAVIVMASVGFKNEESRATQVAAAYSIAVNGNVTAELASSHFTPDPENFPGRKEDCFTAEISLDRRDTVQIFRNGENLTNVEIYWSGDGVSQPYGSFYMWAEGLYDIILTEKYDYDGATLIHLSVTLKRKESAYEKITLYFVDSYKQPYELSQINENTPDFDYLVYGDNWYLKDCALEEGDRIYFFATLKGTGEVRQITGFGGNAMFGEVYDEATESRYLEVRQTRTLEYLMIMRNYSTADLTLDYMFSS